MFKNNTSKIVNAGTLPVKTRFGSVPTLTDDQTGELAEEILDTVSGGPINWPEKLSQGLKQTQAYIGETEKS